MSYRSDLDTIGLWHLDGNGTDSSGNGHHDNDVSGTSWIDGVQGQAYTASATAHINIPHNDSLNLEGSDFTVEGFALGTFDLGCVDNQ